MRRRSVAPLLVVAVLLLAGAAVAATPLQTSAQLVRNAIPSVEAYNADHGTYTGMTLAKLRYAYDRSLRAVAVRRATRTGYCVESTTRPYAHKDGPAAAIRTGRCGVRGTVVPGPSSPPAQPVPNDEAQVVQRLRAAQASIEGFAVDNGGYSGVTIDKLHRYDRGIQGITIAWARRDAYCIEATSGSTTYHLVGPAEAPKPGSCPAPR